jgi:hypothetical protein
MPAAQEKLAILFKPTEGGYVFRAPNPWVFGQANHYFVTDAQKAQILDTMKMPLWLAPVIWMGFLVLFVAGGTLLLYNLSGHAEPTTADTAIIIALAFVGVLLPLPLMGYWQLYRLKPIMQTLHSTNERISFREMTEATRVATSARGYMRNSILFGFAFGMMMLNVGLSLSDAITKGRYTTLILWSVSAILFGFAMAKNGILAMRKADKP